MAHIRPIITVMYEGGLTIGVFFFFWNSMGRLWENCGKLWDYFGTRRHHGHRLKINKAGSDMHIHVVYVRFDLKRLLIDMQLLQHCLQEVIQTQTSFPGVFCNISSIPHPTKPK